MKLKIFAFSILLVTTTIILLGGGTINTNAQETPPTLEAPKTVDNDSEAATATKISLGKMTIQISQTEQIIIDLPLKTDNKYKVVPIK